MSLSAEQIAIGIRLAHNDHELETCARLMATTDPWITLKRSYEESLQILGDETKELYVALLNEEIVGFILIQMHGSLTGYIQAVAIMPGWRGKGIGSKLLRFAEERIFRHSPNVFICVSSFNHGAQQLYARLGFERVGELKDYIVAGHAEILLRKTIGPIAEFTPES